MNAQAPPRPLGATALAGLPHTPSVHLRLGLFTVAAHLIEACAGGDVRAAIAAFPFLAEYREEVAALLGADGSAAQLRDAVRAWEAAAPPGVFLPLRALASAGVGAVACEWVLAAGLVEEDPRFGDLFEQATGRERRPTVGLLLAWWRDPARSGSDMAELRGSLQRLQLAGLAHPTQAATPQSEWPVVVPAPIWSALQGQPPEADGIRHIARSTLTPLADYVAAEPARRLYAAVPALLLQDPQRLLIVRGPAGNGRRTLIGGIAHAVGRGLLLGDGALAADPARWRSFGALAVLMAALPAIELKLGPGENRIVPALPFPFLPLAVVAGGRGGIATEDDRAVLTIERPLPDAAGRRQLWERAAPSQDAATLDQFAAMTRLGSGMIARCARSGATRAALEGRAVMSLHDIRDAARALGATRLEASAMRVETQGTLDDLALDDATREDLSLLAARCRHREALAAAPFDPDRTCGVRALFAGPSGTGKTFAARLLAATLGKDLYRIDLASTMSKYIGETEKNLDAAFSAAEELDIVLLLDEGDALMTARTDVASSNDRYANLETNFLLQRVEQFCGILLVTTNAADRIDRAFARRMDVVVQFRLPDEQRRHEILRQHLGNAAVSDLGPVLEEIVWRCPMSGGQLRNVVQHARLLALHAARPLAAEHLVASVRREYRKTGAPSPLKAS